MNIGQSNVEHNLRLIDNIINVIAHRFYKFKVNHTEDNDDEHLSMLAGKIGYLVNISIGSTKTWNYEERIKSLEAERNDPISAKTKQEFMFNPDIMLTVVRDSSGKIMN